MDSLPPNVFFKIMLYLPPMDRLGCSLTCRRWAEAMTSSILLDDVWLDIAGHEMEAARSVLVNSERQYTKLLLYEVELSEFDSEFWRTIGANLRVLELYKCPWSAHLFFAVLQQCTELESLRIVNGEYWEEGMQDLVPPEGASLEELHYLRHLHLNIKLTADILDSLLRLMPSVTSLFLSSTDYVEPDFLERLPSILKKNQIICTGADLHLMDSDEILKFVEITSGSLEELRIDHTELSRNACDAIVECTKLRRLAFEGYFNSFDESHLKKLVSNSPDLEILELNGVSSLGDEEIVDFSKLKRLRTLALRNFRFRSKEGYLRRFGEMPTLTKLDLIGSYVDSGVIWSLGYLRSLRSLVLRGCLDFECFEAICENFDRLIELDLGDVRDLSDVDMRKLYRFKELRSLRFTDGIKITDFAFERGVGPREMKSLVMKGCSLTDAGLASIALHHDRLEKLILDHCKEITEAGVVSLLRKEPRLKELSLIGFKSRRRDFYTVLRDLRPRLRRLFF